MFGTSTFAQDPVSPRLQIGISLLPGVIAANKGLSEQVDDNQRLPIYLVHRHSRQLADQLGLSLAQIPKVRGYPLDVSSITLNQLLDKKPKSIGAIFIVEPLDDELHNLINFSKKSKALLFSPFKGDVKRGVAAGFQVTDKVLPTVNMTSLKNSNIQLKAFFLRIAVKHE